MISKDELVKNVAESCGVALEISDFFFEVFVNRLSNRIKPGEILHFNNFGYFQKRNCRIQLEKSSDSPSAKAYLVKLVIFSLEPKIKNDLNSVHFLKIPNLKTLWVDDQDFQKSLEAGDFAPYTERNQLINSFATKAEVIISGLRKDYDHELEDELVIPLTFDLNFLIKTGQKSIPSQNRGTETFTNKDKDNTRDEPSKEKITENGLPWNYGTKFSEKREDDKTSENLKKKESIEKLKKDKLDKSILEEKDQLQKDSHKASGLNDFEPVPSHLSNDTENIDDNVDYDTIKFSLGKKTDVVPEGLDTEKKFTEVKAKTDTYNLKGDNKKGKKKTKGDKSSSLSETRFKYQSYREGRNYLPVIMLFAFIIIAGTALYLYLFKDSTSKTGSAKVIYNVVPPSSVNIIERDYEFAITYPYTQTESRVKIAGYNPDIFYSEKPNQEMISNLKSKENSKKTELAKEKPKPEITKEVKPKVNEEPQPKVKEESQPEVKVEPSTESKQETEPDLTEQKSSRIFFYKGYFVVYIGTFTSQEKANAEAEKYNNLGYNSFLEVIEKRGRQTEYKLNVGDFTSEDFARQFESKYLK